MWGDLKNKSAWNTFKGIWGFIPAKKKGNKEKRGRHEFLKRVYATQGSSEVLGW